MYNVCLGPNDRYSIESRVFENCLVNVTTTKKHYSQCTEYGRVVFVAETSIYIFVYTFVFKTQESPRPTYLVLIFRLKLLCMCLSIDAFDNIMVLVDM